MPPGSYEDQLRKSCEPTHYALVKESRSRRLQLAGWHLVGADQAKACRHQPSMFTRVTGALACQTPH